MSEAIAALLGALVGAAAILGTEAWKYRREGSSIRRAVLTDMIRWSEACSYAADDRRRVVLDPSGMAWKEIAAAAAMHYPPHLFGLLFALYQEREQTEFAYRTLMSDEFTGDAATVRNLLFSLRHWVVGADEFMKEQDRYYGRSRWYRRILTLRPTASGGNYIGYYTEILERRVAKRLHDEFGYDVAPDSSLRVEIERMERNRAERNAWLQGE